MKHFFKLIVLISLTMLVNQVLARGAPVSLQTSKYFKNFIIQGERPEIAACLAATATLIKSAPQLKNLDWFEASSENALMQEVEENNTIERKISLKGKGILNSSSFLDVTIDIQIDCLQVNQADPKVKITLIQPKD